MFREINIVLQFQIGKLREEEERWCIDVAQHLQTKTFLLGLSNADGPLCPAAKAEQQMANKVKEVMVERRQYSNHFLFYLDFFPDLGN